uniref:Uncharacterized protein n=1 Tax=Manihot esculenta TaxID=3983 RepID=A0A2C9UDU7_MANES
MVTKSEMSYAPKVNKFTKIVISCTKFKVKSGKKITITNN